VDKRTRLYAQLLDASKQRRETNIAEHKLRTGRIKRSLGARRKLRETKKETNVPKVPLDFLAIGDSWFEYPLYNEVLSFQNNAIVAKSQLGSLGSPPPQILNQALHGQATTAMLSWENQDKMITVLQDPDQWLNEETGLPDAILVSAGGDDLVGDQLAIYLDYGGGGLNLKRFQGVLDSVRASYFFCVPRHLRERRTYHRPLLRLRDPERCPPHLYAICMAVAVVQFRGIRLR
jgi:hypothetical protein